jgi:hypothetical protein
MNVGDAVRFKIEYIRQWGFGSDYINWRGIIQASNSWDTGRVVVLWTHRPQVFTSEPQRRTLILDSKRHLEEL